MLQLRTLRTTFCRLADNPLILGQRLSEWCGHGPVLEEDLALANVALDLIGQARLLLGYAGTLEGKGRDEDQLAFLRAEPEYRNFTLVELPNGDFGATVVRNLLFSAYQLHLWEALQQSRDHELAAIAGKSLKETRYHLRHAADWIVRLGDGTEESHARVQSALDHLWPYTAELFAADAVDDAAAADGLRRRRAPRSKRAGTRRCGRSWRRPRCVSRNARRSAPAASSACTASTWGICWPRCSTCSAPIPVCSGEAAVLTQAQAWDVLRAVPDPEIPVISVCELGIVREVRHERRRGDGRRHAHLLGLSGD